MKVVVDIDELGKLGAQLDRPELAAETLRLLIGRSPSLVDVVGAAAIEPPTGDELQRELLDLLDAEEWISSSDLIRTTSGHREVVMKALKDLEAEGRVEHQASGRAYEWRLR